MIVIDLPQENGSCFECLSKRDRTSRNIWRILPIFLKMRFPYGARYFWGNTIEIRELFKYRWRPLSASRYSTKCRKLSNKYEKKRRKKENDGTEKDEGKETKIYLRVPLIIVREKLEAVDAVFHWTFVSKWERIVCWTNDAAIAVPNLSDLSERIFSPEYESSSKYNSSSSWIYYTFDGIITYNKVLLQVKKDSKVSYFISSIAIVTSMNVSPTRLPLVQIIRLHCRNAQIFPTEFTSYVRSTVPILTCIAQSSIAAKKFHFQPTYILITLPISSVRFALESQLESHRFPVVCRQSILYPSRSSYIFVGYVLSYPGELYGFAAVNNAWSRFTGQGAADRPGEHVLEKVTFSHVGRGQHIHHKKLVTAPLVVRASSLSTCLLCHESEWLLARLSGVVFYLANWG